MKLRNLSFRKLVPFRGVHIAAGDTACGLFVNVVVDDRATLRERIRLRYRPSAPKGAPAKCQDWSFDEFVSKAELKAWLADKECAEVVEAMSACT